VFQNGRPPARRLYPIDNVIGGRAAARLEDADERARRRPASRCRRCPRGHRFAAHTRAYARIREHSTSHRRFEAFKSARPHGCDRYLVDAARRLTCAGIDQGHSR